VRDRGSTPRPAGSSLGAFTARPYGPFIVIVTFSQMSCYHNSMLFKDQTYRRGTTGGQRHMIGQVSKLASVEEEQIITV
jgi:hypothetical protein